MRKFFGIMSDLGSVILAVGLYAYFVLAAGHEPSNAIFASFVAFALAVVYGLLEAIPVMSGKTPSPLYLAFETFFSYIPLFAFCAIGTLFMKGHIVISSFQWFVAVVFLVVILLDVLGFLTILSQRLLLTDEYKGVK